jgi:hypothetical protein
MTSTREWTRTTAALCLSASGAVVVRRFVRAVVFVVNKKVDSFGKIERSPQRVPHHRLHPPSPPPTKFTTEEGRHYTAEGREIKRQKEAGQLEDKTS